MVPSETITARLPQLKKRFASAPYLEFGWRDKGFYQSEEITSSLTFQAIFLPTESVIHVVEVTESAENYFPHSEVTTICLNKGFLTQNGAREVEPVDSSCSDRGCR